MESTPALPLEAKPSLARMLDNPWALSLVLGVLSFAVTVLIEPPFFMVMLALSLPFFYYVANARWRHAMAWTLLTVPFQYYFNLGGVALTLTELYMFLFAGAYFLSRVVPARAFAFPSLLLFPLAYALTPFLPCLLGKLSVAKEGVRIAAAVFFCLRLSMKAFPRMNAVAF